MSMSDLQAERLVVEQTPRALQLAQALREGDRDLASELLQVDQSHLVAMLLALAMVAPPEASVFDVLEECSPQTQERYGHDAAMWEPDQLRAAHSQYTRKVRTAWAIAGEREYQRRRHERRKRLRAVEAEAMALRSRASADHQGVAS